MKLFLSALLLAAVPAAFAQAAPDPSNIGVAGMQGPNGQPSPEQAAKFQAQIQQLMQRNIDRLSQAGCPLHLTGAEVAAPAGYLPVGQRTPDDGTLSLHFRDQSGKAIRSASITATVKVKTNIYDLDAHAVPLHLTFSGSGHADRDLDQLTQIQLPRHYYVFGLAEVSLDRVSYADGTSWTAPRQGNYCGTHRHGVQTIEAK